MNLLHFLCMNVFDQLCVHKILRLTQIPRLQKNKKNIVTWVVKQYIMIACRYSHFSFSFPSENENLKKYFLLNILIKKYKK